jgi:hypothetical protein
MLIHLSGIPLRILKLPTEWRKLVGSTNTKASSLNISFTYDLSLEYVWGDMASQLPVFSTALKAFLSNIFKNPYSQKPLNTHLNGENIPISKG